MCQCGISGIDILILCPAGTTKWGPAGCRRQLLEPYQPSTSNVEKNHCQTWFISVVIDFTWKSALRFSRKGPINLIDLEPDPCLLVYITDVQPYLCLILQIQRLHARPRPLNEGDFYSYFLLFYSTVTLRARSPHSETRKSLELCWFIPARSLLLEKVLLSIRTLLKNDFEE